MHRFTSGSAVNSVAVAEADDMAHARGGETSTGARCRNFDTKN
jgi:hypothetical protein